MVELTLNSMDVKYVSSIIRNQEKLKRDLKEGKIKVCYDNPSPKTGDIVIVKVLDDKKGCKYGENLNANLIDLVTDDIIIASIGDRHSGTYNFGEVPTHAVTKGDTLELLALAGIVGHCIAADAGQQQRKATPLEVLGFLADENGNICNIKDYCVERLTDKNHLDTPIRPKLTIVFGSSAETGKTTLVNNIIKKFKLANRNERILAIKACGTGRLKDKLSYLHSGADKCLDFVDFGYCSTYCMDDDKFENLFNSYLDYAINNNYNNIILEIGGDLLEAKADRVVEFSKRVPCNVVFIVNDAMAALYGMPILKSNNPNVYLSTWRQNCYSMQRRMGIDKIYDATNMEDIKALTQKVFMY